MMESTFGIPLSDNKVSVNADLTGKQKRYIQIRMEQLEKKEKNVTMTMIRCGSLVAFKN